MYSAHYAQYIARVGDKHLALRIGIISSMKLRTASLTAATKQPPIIYHILFK
jgi:hypothetical protein